MKKEIIIINGTGESGKDTFVEFCSKYEKIYNFSSIDKVKEVATIIGWNGKKTEKDRKFLSDLKRLTTEYNDMAFKSIVDAVEKFNQDDNKIMFIHIREPYEIKRASEAFNAKTLLIKRKGHKNITSNDSDAFVDNYDYDYTIENDTLEQLEESAKKFVDIVLKKNEYKPKRRKLTLN